MTLPIMKALGLGVSQVKFSDPRKGLCFLRVDVRDQWWRTTFSGWTAQGWAGAYGSGPLFHASPRHLTMEPLCVFCPQKVISFSNTGTISDSSSRPQCSEQRLVLRMHMILTCSVNSQMRRSQEAFLKVGFPILQCTHPLIVIHPNIIAWCPLLDVEKSLGLFSHGIYWLYACKSNSKGKKKDQNPTNCPCAPTTPKHSCLTIVGCGLDGK